MKKLTLLLVFTGIITTLTYGQDEDYKVEITQKICDCINEQDLPSMTSDDLEIQFGLCLFSAIDGYEKELELELGEPFDIEKHSGKMGEMVGVKMVTVCPDIIQKLIDLDAFGEEQEKINSKIGIIQKINTSEFISFTLTTDDGNTSTFYWMTEITSNIDMKTSYTSLKKEKVFIEYQKIPMFNATSGTYEKVKVITRLTKLDE